MRDEDLIEAALFVAGKPVAEKKLRDIVGSLARARRAAKNLIIEYEKRDSALEIIELDRKYVMQVKHEFSHRVKSVAPKELSSPVLRTLAMIAYHQPVVQSFLVQIRGNSVYDHLTELKEKNLIVATPHGRTYVLTTGPAFPDYFNLKTNDLDEIKKKIVALARKQTGGLDRWLHKKPVILTTPMYESLLRHCGVKDFTVSQELYSNPEGVEELEEASVVVISKGYAGMLEDYFEGEIIEVGAATFEDLIVSMKKLQHLGREEVVREAIIEIEEMREKCVDRAMGLTLPVVPVTDMAGRIAKELRLHISSKGKKMAPDYGTTRDGVEVTSGAEILIPTHQSDLDILERVNLRYQSIISQIKELEERVT